MAARDVISDLSRRIRTKDRTGPHPQHLTITCHLIVSTES